MSTTPEQILKVTKRAIAKGDLSKLKVLARGCRHRARATRAPAWLALAHLADAGFDYVQAPGWTGAIERVELKLELATRLA